MNSCSSSEQREQRGAAVERCGVEGLGAELGKRERDEANKRKYLPMVSCSRRRHGSEDHGS